MQRKSALQVGIAAVLALGLVLLPAMSSLAGSSAQWPASSQFTVMPPINPTLGAVFTATPELPTPIATLGPGQSFGEAQEDQRPDVIRPDLLENSVGYSEILGRPGLFLVWSTDEHGNKRYFVVEDTNPYFLLIRAEVDKIMTKRSDMMNNLSMSKLIGGGIAALGLGIIGGACGVGAVLSLGATPISAPVTAALTACSGTALSFAAGALGLSLDGWESITTYVRTYQESSKQIEAYITQLPYSTQP